MIDQDRYSQARKITLIGAAVNALLGLMKLVGGNLYHSHALVADGVHSFSDLLTDVMVLLASKYGSVDADDSHPYGHQRIETAATLLLSLLLILAGIGIAWDSINDLINGHLVKPDWLSLPVILVSIVANETLFYYTHHVGNKINSPLIIANAWHHRSDAASSFVVFIGLVGSLYGYTYLDAIAATIVGIMIIKMGCTYGWNSVRELVDTAVEPALLAQIEQVIYGVSGVKKIHQLRSRYMGNDVLIDVHIQVSPKISVSEGHYIAQQVHRALVDKISSVTDAVVHVDPEDDEINTPCFNLPNRKNLENSLKEVQDDFPQILFWNLHYLNGKISLDVICSKEFKAWNDLYDRILSALELQAPVEEIRLMTIHEKKSASKI